MSGNDIGPWYAHYGALNKIGIRSKSGWRICCVFNGERMAASSAEWELIFASQRDCEIGAKSLSAAGFTVEDACEQGGYERLRKIAVEHLRW